MIKVVNNKVMYEEKAYNFLNAVVRVILPAFATFYFAMSQVIKLPDATPVIGSISAACVFLGATLHVSSNNYDSSGAAHIGTVALIPNANGTALSMHVDPADIVGKDSVSLKVIPPPAPTS